MTNIHTVTGPLTDTQLRASAVSVTAASLPLPSGAATDTTVGNVKTSVDSVNTTANSILSHLTASTTTTSDLVLAIKYIIDLLANPINQDPTTGRLRVSLEGAAYNFTIPTVSTVSSITNMGTKSMESFVFDNMANVWATCVRSRLT